MCFFLPHSQRNSLQSHLQFFLQLIIIKGSHLFSLLPRERKCIQATGVDTIGLGYSIVETQMYKGTPTLSTRQVIVVVKSSKNSAMNKARGFDICHQLTSTAFLFFQQIAIVFVVEIRGKMGYIASGKCCFPLETKLIFTCNTFVQS